MTVTETPGDAKRRLSAAEFDEWVNRVSPLSSEINRIKIGTTYLNPFIIKGKK